jgi:hypothetical protein
MNSRPEYTYLHGARCITNTTIAPRINEYEQLRIENRVLCNIYEEVEYEDNKLAL